MTTTTCCQFSPRLGEVEANVDESLELFGEAVDAGARIVVFPELTSSGYAFADSAEVEAAAQSADGYAVSRWRQAADEHRAVIVAGFCEANEHGRPFNSAALLVPGRDPVIYRKVHLWDAERTIFTPGGAAPPVVETEHGRVDRKSTRLNSSHVASSYAVFCLKKKNQTMRYKYKRVKR